MSPSIDFIVLVSFDGRSLKLLPSPDMAQSGVEMDEHGNVRVFIDVLKNSAGIAFATDDRNLRFAGVAAWKIHADPVDKRYHANGPIAGTPFSVRSEDGMLILTDDHQGRAGRFGYSLAVDLGAELVHIDPEIENRGEGGGVPKSKEAEEIIRHG